MEGNSQIYLGTPNAAVLCVDGVCDSDTGRVITAEVRHAYRAEPLVVSLTEHMLPELEEMFDMIRFPHRTADLRSFRGEGADKASAGTGYSADPRFSAARVVSDDELLNSRGKLATFIIRVQQRQNCEWQGRVTWVEKNKTLLFRTVAELLRIIDDAICHSAAKQQ